MTIAPIRTASPQSELSDSYRLIFFNASGTHVFLFEQHGRWSFPEVQIPKFTRVFAEIGECIQKTWNINSSLLFSNLTPSADAKRFYAALEAPKDCEELQGLSRCQVSDARALLDDCEDVAFLESCSARLLNPEASSPGPFARLGWIYRIQEWVQQVPEAGEVVSFSQLSGSNDTCLIRFDTSSRTLWYKAVGQSDPKEFSITYALSELLPQYLPRILAFDPNPKAWLMASGGETTLSEAPGFDAWVTTARRLAAMQVDSVCHVPKLLAAGGTDLRAGALREVITPFFDFIDILMQQQVKNPPPPLSPSELTEIAAVLSDAVSELVEIGMPDVIGHSDFNPGNILITGNHSVFIDWSAAHVGSPTLTLEYLIAHFKRSCAAVAGQDDILRKAFREQWFSIIPDPEFHRAQELSPLIAVFASAISDNAWHVPAHLAFPGVPGYLRSLARIMNREAKLLTERRTLA
jgi:hypothetical protein